MELRRSSEGRPRGPAAAFVPIIVAIAAAAMPSGGCGPDEVAEPAGPAEPPVQAAPVVPADRHEAARRAAWGWLDQLDVDPVALTAAGERGKKRLGEILSAYFHLLQRHTDPADRKRILTRVGELAQRTESSEYHNLASCDIREFNRNIMSYLRVAWVLERLGWDTTGYRAQLESVRDRLSSSLPQRSAEARKQFEWYYAYFGWRLPEGAEVKPSEPSLVSRRLPVARYRQSTAYALAHEVSIAYRGASSDDAEPFAADDRAYLRNVLPRLAIRFGSSRRANPDLLAELLSAMAHLDLRTLPAYRTGIERLLRSQNPNGSWGSYEEQRRLTDSDIDTKLYLHTTMVVLRALSQSESAGKTDASRRHSRQPLPPAR